MNPLCKQVVTVYRRRNSTVLREVVDNAFYRYWDTASGRACRLILPGQWDLLPGDKVIAGIGPEEIDWFAFLPEKEGQLTVLSRTESAVGYTLGG